MYLAPGEPTPHNPEIYDRAIMNLGGGEEGFIIPRRWKSRVNQAARKNVRLMEIRDCGSFVVLLPRVRNPREMKKAPRKGDEPSIKKPEIYFQTIRKMTDREGDGFVIPTRWKKRMRGKLSGQANSVELLDCGLYLVLKAKMPNKKIGIMDWYDD